MRQTSFHGEYVLGRTETEEQRLLAQTAGFESLADSLLDRLQIGPGWRAIDVGCGPLGILASLARRVGPQGAVIGVEREFRFAEMARRQISERALQNVTIVQADGRATALPPSSFD